MKIFRLPVIAPRHCLDVDRDCARIVHDDSRSRSFLRWDGPGQERPVCFDAVFCHYRIDDAPLVFLWLLNRVWGRGCILGRPRP